MPSAGFENAISGTIPLENYIGYAFPILRTKITEKTEKIQRTKNLILSYELQELFSTC